MALAVHGEIPATSTASPVAPTPVYISPEIALKDYIEVQLKWVERYLDERLKAMNMAVDKAALAVDERLRSMNEFRASLKDQASTFATKSEITGMEERIKLLELTQAQAAGRATITSVLWSTGISAFIGILALVWKRK